MKDSTTPAAVDSDLALLRAASPALLAVGIVLLWRGVPPRADLASRAASD
jgi:hypothetical protein